MELTSLFAKSPGAPGLTTGSHLSGSLGSSGTVSHWSLSPQARHGTWATGVGWGEQVSVTGKRLPGPNQKTQEELHLPGVTFCLGH